MRGTKVLIHFCCGLASVSPPQSLGESRFPVTGGQELEKRGWQTDTDTRECAYNLNVICQIEHQTFNTEENREVRWHISKVQMRLLMLNDSYTKQRNVNTKTGRNCAIKQLRQSQSYLRSAIVLEVRCEVFTLPGQGLSCPSHGSN